MIKSTLHFYRKSTLPKPPLYKITIVQQIEPKQMLVFDEKGKPKVPGEKPLRAEKRTNKLNPHI